MPALALHSFSKAIEIPTSLRDQPLDAWETSARLTAVLDRFGIHVLGDLHGRKVIDFAWEKNCGPKTLYELDLLARRAQFRNGTASCNGHRNGCVHASHTPSHSFSATNSERAAAKIQEDAASFAIPESICHLSFSELPVTRRLANVVRSIGARSLGDLHGRSAFEMLQYRACGWSTISEIQQLIERAVSGEFDVAQIEEAAAAAELLRLLEQGLAKLPLRDRQFVLARVGAQTGSGRSPGADLLCPSYAEIRTTVRTDTRSRTQGTCKLIGYFEENLGSASPAASRSNEVALSLDDLSTDSPIAPEVDRLTHSLLGAATDARSLHWLPIIDGSVCAFDSRAGQKYSLLAGNEP